MAHFQATANGDGVATYAATLGALSAPWDKVNKTMPVGALPADKSTPLILHCRGGVRAQAAAVRFFDALQCIIMSFFWGLSFCFARFCIKFNILAEVQ